MTRSPVEKPGRCDVLIIVQARMGSTRLPGKVLMNISGRPMLAYLVERLRRVRSADKFVVATSTAVADDAIAAFCSAAGVAVSRGPEFDVLLRFVETARAQGACTIVRITADCPLMDPLLVDSAIEAFSPRAGRFDYLSNMLEPSWPLGMAVEVFTAAALEEAGREASDPDEREHVTPFLWRRPERYRLRSMTMTPDLSGRRWTVDTPEDFALVSRIISALYPRNPEFTMKDVLTLLAENPSWESINRHVPQKRLPRGQPAAR